VTGKKRQSLSDEELLARRDWRPFTDDQLRRAVTLARWQARATFRKRRLEVLQGADWALMEEKPNLLMYLACCAYQRDDQDMSEWDNYAYVDSINDPRIYEYCTAYDSYQRRFLGLPRLRKNRLLLADLLRRRAADLRISERSLRANQQEYERQTPDWQDRHRTMFEAMSKGHFQLVQEYLLYRMLLCHATGVWIKRAK
jgi:hypothetical protein